MSDSGVWRGKETGLGIIETLELVQSFIAYSSGLAFVCMCLPFIVLHCSEE